ncbi:MAG: SRPBCC family protein, partial [Rhizomicrobium sp.]
LKISRTFHAAREIVFKAWSSPDHVKHWFCPAQFTAPEARVEMRVGGPFEVCMRAPDGTEHWTRGAFAEVVPFERLVLDLHAEDANGHRLFGAWTEVTFAEVLGGTRMDVVQSYSFADAGRAAPMIAGAPAGWSQTLDRLEVEISRMRGGGGLKRSVVHATFSVERTYEAPLERVFRALSDETAKSKWFSGEAGRWQMIERRMDFRVGGRERLKGRWDRGVVSTFDAIYHDIVPNERIVYTYDMHLDEAKISVSLATIQLRAENANRTALKITEQGAFLDGYDDAGSRERGTGLLLDRLGASLAN